MKISYPFYCISPIIELKESEFTSIFWRREYEGADKVCNDMFSITLKYISSSLEVSNAPLNNELGNIFVLIMGGFKI